MTIAISTKNSIRIGLVMLVSLALFLGLGALSKIHAAASLYLSASTTTVYPGQSFTVYPMVNTGGASTNAYSVSISYSNIIQATGISKGGSICSLYTSEPSYTASSASISCGLPSPGYNGAAGGLGSITFRALNKGTAYVSVVGGQVLANDGVGTNILGSTGSVAINIVDPPPPPVSAPEITCTPAEDGVWTSTKEVTCSWTTPSGATGFSYILTQDQGAAPGRISMGTGTSKTFSDLADGTYYFKIIATKDDQWSNAATYTILIDTTPPTDLEIVSSPSADEEIDILPMISFNATDATSGIQYYEIKIDDGEWIRTNSPYKVPEITSGTHTITVRAVDNAGNKTEETLTLTVAEIPAPIITKPRQGEVLPIGQDVIIEGTTSPDSIVYIYLDGELIAEIRSDKDGFFSFTYNKLLRGGEHEIYAQSKDDGGILSLKSDIIKFTVDIYAIKIGNYVIPSVCAGSVLILLFLLLVLLILFIIRKYKAYRRSVDQNLDEAKRTVKKEFDELERDVREDVEETLSKKGTKGTKKEAGAALEKEIDKEIKEAEEGIDKALENVGSDTRKKKKKKRKNRKSKKEDEKEFSEDILK